MSSINIGMMSTVAGDAVCVWCLSTVSFVLGAFLYRLYLWVEAHGEVVPVSVLVTQSRQLRPLVVYLIELVREVVATLVVQLHLPAKAS